MYPPSPLRHHHRSHSPPRRRNDYSSNRHHSPFDRQYHDHHLYDHEYRDSPRKYENSRDHPDYRNHLVMTAIIVIPPIRHQKSAIVMLPSILIMNVIIIARPLLNNIPIAKKIIHRILIVEHKIPPTRKVLFKI